MKTFLGMTRKEILDLEYEKLVELISYLNLDERMELSSFIGYQVFNRLCMVN